MRRSVWLVLLIVVAFAAVVAARLPARWISSGFPAGLACGAASGTIWRGDCAALTLHSQPVGRLSWQLHPLALLAGRLDADARVDGPSLMVQAGISLTPGGNIRITDLKLDAQLPTPLITRLQGNLTGRLTADLPRALISNGWVREVGGRIQATQLISGGPQPAPLGGFELLFDAPAHDGKLVGRLHDLGGPLDVLGTVTLASNPGYLLEGTVAARQEANEVLVKQLALLGLPDAQGRRRFAQEAEL